MILILDAIYHKVNKVCDSSTFKKYIYVGVDPH